jgi:hypothetical protein
VFASIFNLESKFFLTIGNVWRPAFHTGAYVRGERKKYLNPGRFFIISFFILSAATSYMLKTSSESTDSFDESKDLYTSTIREEMVPLFDSLILRYPLSPDANIDSLRNGMFFSKEQMAKDSIESPPLNINYSLGYGVSQGNVNVGNKNYRISTDDIRNLSNDDLIKKYKIEGLFNQTVFSQYINYKKDARSWIIFMITNSLWTIVLSTFILAFFMKLLYIRRPYYYVEHLILLMTFQSFVFLLAVLAIIFGYFSESLSDGFWFVIKIGGSIWFLKSLKDYYKQSWSKTIVKSFLLFMVHTIILTCCFLLLGGVSAILYQ